MLLNLLKFGIIVIPFYEIAILVFPFARVLSIDTRDAKSLLAIILSFGISFLCLYQGKMRSERDKWLLGLIGAVFLSILLKPRLPIVVNDINANGFWAWEFVVYMVGYLLLYLTVSSLHLTKQKFQAILKVMCYTSAGMACYIVLQKLGITQFYHLKEGTTYVNFVPSASLVGNLGQPTIAGAFMALSVPLFLYLRKYFCLLIVVGAVFLTQSQMAMGAMVLSGLFSLLLNKKWLAVALIIVAIVAGVAIKGVDTNMSGRKGEWKKVVHQWKGPIKVGDQDRYFSITGFGPGSFEYLYHTRADSIFHNAHNEYLEILYELGVVGMVAFLGFCVHMVKKVRKVLDLQKYIDFGDNRLVIALISALICSCLLAGGNFIWHIPPTAFYTVVLLGLLNNVTKNGGVNV